MRDIYMSHRIKSPVERPYFFSSMLYYFYKQDNTLTNCLRCSEYYESGILAGHMFNWNLWISLFEDLL